MQLFAQARTAVPWVGWAAAALGSREEVRRSSYAAAMDLHGIGGKRGEVDA
jgi:hypothetical protein